MVTATVRRFLRGMSMDDIFSMFGDIFGGHSGAILAAVSVVSADSAVAHEQRRYRGLDLRASEAEPQGDFYRVEKKFKLKSMYPAATILMCRG